MLKTARLALLLPAVLIAIPNAAFAQAPAPAERIAASFVLALGRVPTATEIEGGAQPASVPFADLIARHRQQLAGSPSIQRSTVERAVQDAFGRTPTEDESKAAAPGTTYTELMQGYLQRLADTPAEYEQVLNRAYQRLLKRDAYSIEVDYWKRQPVTSFAMLSACIEDWARRNQPGLMATAGTASVSVNSDYLAVVRLSPAAAAEIRAATGLGPVGERALAAAAGRHVIAPGGAQIVSVGGIHFAAAGK